jgi:thiol-disulfide isomerase/thioredoxin
MNKLFKMLYRPSFVSMLLLFFVVVSIVYFLFFRKNNSIENFGTPASCTYYYMEQCGHCKRFSPEWDNFVQSYTGPVTLRKVDMSEAGSDLEKYNIRGFPTILIVDENGEYKDYDGPRTSEALTKFLDAM